MALQAPGQEHLGATVCREFSAQGELAVHLVVHMEHMDLRGSRLHCAGVSQDVQALIIAFQQELRLGSSPVRVCRDSNASYNLKEFSYAQELLFHAGGLSVHPLHEPPLQVLEEDHCHLSTHGFSLVGPLLLASQGLVLCNVENTREIAGQPVHEALLEHTLDVVPPGQGERASRGSRSWWSSSRTISKNMSKVA